MTYVPFGHLDTSGVEKQYGRALVVTGDAHTLQQLAQECASFLDEHGKTAWVHVYHAPAGARLIVGTINRNALHLHVHDLITQRISEGMPVQLDSGNTFVQVDHFTNHPPGIDLEDIPDHAF